MDLSNYVPNEKTIEILDPATKEPIGLRVTMMAFTDPRLKKLKTRISDRRLALQAKGRSFKQEELQENGNELLFASITGWEWYNDLTWRGEKNPTLNRVNVFDMFDTLPWLRDQLDTELGDEQSFFSRSRKN